MASAIENQVNVNGNAHDDAVTTAAVAVADEIVTNNKPVKPANAEDEKLNQKNAGSSPETKTNGDTSTAEVTKRSIRVQTWKKIEEKDISVTPHLVFNKIPNFIGAEKAAQTFTEISEFKGATNIKVDVERMLDTVKYHILSAGKNLYISKGKRSNSLFTKVMCAPDEEIEMKKKVIMHLDEYGQDISFTENVELDLLVIGSVAVSKTGQRIGRGNGYVDLDFAILKHCGAVTDKTIIITIVHDEQIYDTLPNELFTSYDVPVDIIITPTQVLRIENRLQRPDGIQWNLLSERRLGIVPVLKLIKESEEQAGKIIVLKDDDTDVETKRGRLYRRFFNRPRKQRNDTDGENNDSKPQRQRKRFFPRSKKQHSKTGDDSEEQSSSENKRSPTKTKNASESEANEVSKRSIRMKTWKEFSENRCAAMPYLIYNRIPNFIGAEKAAALLADTEEFKNAKTFKINSDKAQDPVKIKVINDSKDLFVSTGRESTALYTKINCPHDAESEVKQMAIRSQHLAEYGHDIDFNDKVHLDMVIIGSVAVSKSGQRIGRGQGFVDLEFGILVKAGVVNDQTTIVTTVHHQQVSDSLPDELFAEHDVPVDIIVTPNEIIRVENRRKRPDGIYWNLLTKRRVDMIPVLKTLKEKDESDGIAIELKEEDENEIRRKSGPRLFWKSRRNHRTRSENNGNGKPNADVPNRRRFMRQRKPKASVTDATDGEQSSNEKRIRPRNKRQATGYCIKVSRIPKTTRPKTLKAELKEHGCSPMHMVWKGSRHTCYLYFGKQGGGVDDTDYEEEAIREVESALANLTINDSTEANLRKKVRVEFLKRNNNQNSHDNTVNTNGKISSENRIETVDVSSV